MSRYFNTDVFLKSVKQKAYPQSGSVNESERKISLFGIMEILTAMPTADVVEVEALKQTAWIPCSEKLPEVGNTTYLVTVDYGEFGGGTGQRFFYNKEIGWDDDAVVAWMPLPEPWGGVKG